MSAMGSENIGSLPFILSAIMDSGAGRPVTMASINYYERLAAHITSHDAELMDLLTRAIVHVQKTYRTATQYQFHVSMVPVQKHVDNRVREFLDQECPVCLQALHNDPRGVVRMKAAAGGCGHFIHTECLHQFEAQNLHRIKSCPLCCADLGYVVELWDDHESAVPKF
jgi:hypothetical protein